MALSSKYIWAFVLLAICILGYFLYSYNFPSATWRYRITVEVQTPEGLKTGSAVREVSASTPLISLPDVGNAPRVRGEAVAIDLGNRGKLFALIDWDSYREVYYAFPKKGPSTPAGIKYYSSLASGSAAQLSDAKHWPKMVRFKNLDDPLSVEEVNPENLSISYGSDVILKKITVEIVYDQVEWKIDEVLPWIGDQKSRLDGQMFNTSNKLSNRLSVSNFRRDFK